MNQKILAFFILLLFLAPAFASFNLVTSDDLYPNPRYNQVQIEWDESLISITPSLELLPTPKLTSPNQIGNFEFGDADNDGDYDIFYSWCENGAKSEVSYHPNTGDNLNPVFGTEISIATNLAVNNCTAYEGRSIAVCDFNRDGLVDFFVGYDEASGTDTLRYYEHASVGTSWALKNSDVLPENMAPVNGIECKDYDGDEYPDLIHFDGSQFSFYKNTNGTIAGLTADFDVDIGGFPTCPNGQYVVYSDVDGDGIEDLIHSCNKQAEARWTTMVGTNAYTGIVYGLGNLDFNVQYDQILTTHRPSQFLKENPFSFPGILIDVNALGTGDSAATGLQPLGDTSGYYIIKRNGLPIESDYKNKYYTDTGLSSSTTYTYKVESYEGDIKDDESNELEVTTLGFPFTVTNISNLGSYRFDSLHLTPIDEENDIIIRVDHNYTYPEDLEIFIENSLEDGRQYFINTATPAQYPNFLFQDSLTFGASGYGEPVQKIYNTQIGKYEYSFTDSFLGSETKYYKLSYRQPSRHYSTVLNSPSWSNDYQPENGDINGISRDYWTISAFSNIFTRNLDATAISLDDGGLHVTGYELQFNAYKTTNQTVNVIVGLIDEYDLSQITLGSIAITSEDHRYSFPLDMADLNYTLFFKTTADTFSDTVYFSDYALVEKTYFRDRLELLQENYEPIPVWIDQNVESYKYIEEGQSFRFETTAFDREGTLKKQIVEVYAYGVLDQNKVFREDKNLEGGEQDTVRTIQGPVSGIVLTQEGKVAGVATPLVLQVTLCDYNVVSGETCYAQQKTNFKLHNYPFFSYDFFLQTQEKARILNTGPHGRLFVQARKPNTIERLKMRIFRGKYLCPPDFLGSYLDTVLCDASNTAEANDLVYQRIFYRPEDFDCGQNEDCSFDYDLENEFHYYAEGDYTTFTSLHFNTSDSNNFFSRTIYDVGQQSYGAITTEVQGQPVYAVTDQNCGPSLFGTSLKGHATIEAMINTFNQNEALNNYIFGKGFPFGYIFAGEVVLFEIAVFANNGEVPDGWKDSEIGRLVNYDNCIFYVTTSQAVKIVSKLTSATGEDFHNYITASLYLTEYADDNSTVTRFLTNRFFPIQAYFDAETLQNIYVWNTNLYDSVGQPLLDHRRYRIDINFNDESLQHIDGNDTAYIHTASDLVYDQNELFSLIPVTKYAVDTRGNFILESMVANSGQHIDEIEVTLYTEFSGFDPYKSDRENQIVHFTIGQEDILKLDEVPSFDVSRDWNRFVQENSGASVWGLCYNNAEKALTDERILGGVEPIYNSIITGVTNNWQELGDESVGVRGCGKSVEGWIVNSVIAPVADFFGESSHITSALQGAMSDYAGKEYKIMRFKFQDFAVNDYDNLVEIGDFNTLELETHPTTILNDLAQAGKTTGRKPIKVYLEGTGRTYTLENNLVGIGNINDLIENHKLKMKIIYRTNYFRNQAFEVIDLVDWQSSAIKKGWLEQLDQWARDAFNKFAILIFAIVLIILAFSVITRSNKGRG